MRVYESARLPLIALPAETFAEGHLAPFRVVAKVSDCLVFFVEQSDAGAQVGHEHQFAFHIDVGGKEKIVQCL